MINEKHIAYSDESGDPSLNLDVKDVSSHFVVAAAIVKASELDVANKNAEEIRRKHFSQAEMKSKNVGSNHSRRIRILDDISSLPVSFFVFVVDKRAISEESGLKYKSSFLKFLTGKVYHRLFHAFPNLDVRADEHGTKEFMEDFRDYVMNNHANSLFETADFSFVDSKSHALVQVSDFVAGSVRRIFSASDDPSNHQKIVSSLKGLKPIYEEWPPLYHRFTEDLSGQDSHALDSLIRDYCRNCVANYLSLSREEPEADVRSAALIYLANMARYSDTDRYISAPELLRHLHRCGFTEVTPHTIRSQIIAHFRDEKVIIASNSVGYKIPTKVSDISNYVNRCDAVIQPMASRLKKAQNDILLISDSQLDILSDERFKMMRELVKSV